MIYCEKKLHNVCLEGANHKGVSNISLKEKKIIENKRI